MPRFESLTFRQLTNTSEFGCISKLAYFFAKKAIRRIIFKNRKKRKIYKPELVKSSIDYRWPGWVQQVENAGLIRFLSKKVAHQIMQLVKDSLGG